MFSFINRHRRGTAAVLTGLVALMGSVIVWAVPGSDSGRWVLSEDFECVDSSLYCVVWEFSPGDMDDQLCCVTAENLAFNVPSCSDFRTERIVQEE